MTTVIIMRTRILIVSGSIYYYYRYISGDMKICRYLRFHTTICLRFHIVPTSAFRRLSNHPWPIFLFHTLWKHKKTVVFWGTKREHWQKSCFYMNRIYREIFALVQLYVRTLELDSFSKHVIWVRILPRRL